jgi:hypothetical protein
MTSVSPTVFGGRPRPMDANADSSRSQSAGEPAARSYWVIEDESSSGFIAGVYAIFIGEAAPTDLAAELIWNRRGYNFRSLARSFRIPRRVLEREIAKLNSMRSAKPGWDGYRAQKPNTRTIDLAINFLRQLSKTDIPLPAATISSSGNASLFDSNENYYLDVEFEPNDHIGWLVQLHGGREIEDDEPFSGDALPPRLTALLRSACND